MLITTSKEICFAKQNPKWTIKIDKYSDCKMSFGIADYFIKHQKNRLQGKKGISHPNDMPGEGALRSGVFVEHSQEVKDNMFWFNCGKGSLKLNYQGFNGPLVESGDEIEVEMEDKGTTVVITINKGEESIELASIPFQSDDKTKVCLFLQICGEDSQSTIINFEYNKSISELSLEFDTEHSGDRLKFENDNQTVIADSIGLS